jgi:hypothetical protein
LKLGGDEGPPKEYKLGGNPESDYNHDGTDLLVPFAHIGCGWRKDGRNSDIVDRKNRKGIEPWSDALRRKKAAADSSPEISAAFEAKDRFVLALETECVGLESPGWSVSKNRRARISNGAVPLRNQEPLDGMGVGGSSVVMMMPKSAVDLAKSFRPLHLGLTFPEHHEALTAYAAAGFNGSF